MPSPCVCVRVRVPGRIRSNRSMYSDWSVNFPGHGYIYIHIPYTDALATPLMGHFRGFLCTSFPADNALPRGVEYRRYARRVGNFCAVLHYAKKIGQWGEP